jgi:hypothetical protein
MRPLMTARPFYRPARRGITPKGCLIAIAAFVVAVVAAILIGLFLLNNYVAGLTARPIEMPHIGEPEKVRQGLEQKIEHAVGPQSIAASPASSAPAAPGETTLTLSGDEANLLLRQVLPPDRAQSVHVTIVNDHARILAPVKGSVVATMLPPAFTTIQSYVSGLNYVNLDMTAKVRYADGKWELNVHKIERPVEISPEQAQKTVADLMAGRNQQPVRLPLGKTEVTLVTLELKDNQAVLRVRP